MESSRRLRQRLRLSLRQRLGQTDLELAETAVISRDDDVAGELARIDRGG